VLDVACGTGVVTRAAAERVASGGRVAGIDLNPGMIAVARSLPPTAGAAIEWHEASALALPFADSGFDVVLCQQGLQFFPDKALALREMRRVLRPGGRLALSVWNNAGPYSTAVVANGFAFLAGQTPKRPDGSKVEGSFTEECEQVFDNLEGYEGAEWVRVSDDVPVDEEGRDRALEAFEARSQGAASLAVDELEASDDDREEAEEGPEPDPDPEEG